MKAIYKMNIDCGRAGNLEGVFVADTLKVKELLDNKTEVYFGEVLGKHSEVEVVFDSPDDLEFVTDDQKVIEVFEQFDLSSGYNPFDYIDTSSEDDEDE